MAGPVVVSPNPKHTKVFIDHKGDEIDQKTKQIIKKNDDEVIPKESSQAIETSLPTEGTLQERINATKRLLDALLAEKQTEIARMKKQIEELEKS